MAQTYQMKHNPQGTIYSLLTVESDGQMTMTFHGTDREISHEVTENADGWLCYPGAMFPGLESGKWQLMDDVRCKMADVVETNTNDTNNTNEVAESETTTTFAIKREQGDTCINHAEREQSQDCESSVNNTNCTNNEPAPVMQMRNEKLEMRNENEEMRNEVAESETTTDDTDCTDNHAEPEVIEENTNCTNYTNNEPLTINHAPLTLNHDCRPRRQRKPRKPRVERQPSTISHQPSSIDHQPSDISRQTSDTMKAIGMVAAATVALFVIYETGLLIPLGLIGLATGGILK